MVKNPANAGDPGSIPGSGRSLGVGNGNALQYSCLENSMDRGAWRATVHGVTKSWTHFSDYTFTFIVAFQCYNSAVQQHESAICAHISPP